jgi:hypothetical protein
MHRMQRAFDLQAQAVHEVVVVAADQPAAMHGEARRFVHGQQVFVEVQQFEWWRFGHPPF